MGYDCPVCATEEADGEHLANHLAFTALMRSDDHEAWLDEHVPDWGDRDPEGLASEVTEYASETDTEPTSGSHDHDVPAVERSEEADLSGEAAEVLAEAEEMTRRMHEAKQEDEEEDVERDVDVEHGANSGEDDERTARDADSENE